MVTAGSECSAAASWLPHAAVAAAAASRLSEVSGWKKARARQENVSENGLNSINSCYKNI